MFIYSTSLYPPMTIHTTRRISFLKDLTAASRYLEVGVCKGQTFNHISFSRKVAVDPKFQFDVSDFQQEGVSFNEITSDEYFLNKSSDEVFDIIFLDGLHTYDQTYRDFCNALSHCHDRTIILIDDTLPSDRFSALRNSAQAHLMRRQESNSDSRDWHGDVFKVLILLKLFHSKFEYATLVGSGNPQTVVWNECSPRLNKAALHPKPFKQFAEHRFLFEVFENIRSVDYNWLVMQNRDLLQECKEADLFAYLSKIFSMNSSTVPRSQSVLTSGGV